MGKGTTTELSDFEKQRLANIAERDALLKKLTQEAQSAGLYTKAPSKTSATNGPQKQHKKKPTPKKVKEEVTPRRTSSRLAGIQADSEVAKRKAEDEYQIAQEAARAKRQRVSGDLPLGDIQVSGKSWDINGNGMFGVDVINKSVAKPYERTFGDDEIKDTTDKELKVLRERMSGLDLWGAWEPNRLKITPERIYAMSFHPTTSKPLVFAGDKLGNLGIVDASQKPPHQVKKEEQEEGDDDDKKPVKVENIDRNPGDTDDEVEEDDPDPEITTLKPHTRTISAMHTHPSAPQTLYTASYDSSIRAIDLQKSVAVEIYAPSDPSEDDPVSGVDMSADDPNVLYFTTLNGAFGRHDRRESQPRTDLFQLSEKKIGGFSLNPLASHYVATASLDRTMKLWDLRKITNHLPTLVGEHESRLSVSHAAFNTAGQVATSSYDDTIKIHSFGSGGTKGLRSMVSWKSGFTLSEDQMVPETVIRHNCQTGRWVTILKPQWQRHPQDGIQKLVIGNMNRFVDVYTADGTQLAQLGGEGITAVPAVAVWHPNEEWIAAGTASGKLCLWM